jgi:hypothetical protein
VPDLDDEQLETYLKRFRPLLPDALPSGEVRRAPQRRLSLAIWALGAVAVLIWGLVSIRNHAFSGESSHSASVEIIVPSQPLTMREVNALLATAPSYKSVMDELALPGHTATVPKEKQSALAVLAKEKIKL